MRQTTGRIISLVIFVFLIGFLTVERSHVLAFSKNLYDSYLTHTACSQPIDYKIGSIDPRFGISESTVEQDAAAAADIWNSVEGKTLLLSDPSDKNAVTINFVYDRRSSLNSQVNNLENQVHEEDNSLQQKVDAYNHQVADYKKRVSDFNAKMDELNKQIRSYNRRGGAPEDVYNSFVQQQDELSVEQTQLQTEGDQLNKVAEELDLSTQDYNSQISQLNSTVNQFNTSLSQRPEEGLYDSGQNTISIYFVNSHNELIHTLAHEMGHALGMEHNSDKLSIMYPSTSEIIAPSSDDLAALETSCSRRYLNVPFIKEVTIPVPTISGI